MPKAIIFDVDGTLVDSVDLHAKAWADAFGAFGHDIGVEELRRQIGKGGDQLLPVFMSKEEIAEKGEALETFRSKVLKEKYLSQITAFADVRALFERLIADGKDIVLASSAKAEELQTYKKITGIEDLLHAQTSSGDAEKSKPHPDIFIAAMRKLEGIDTGEVLVVGDTPYDAEAAAKAGLKTVGFLCGGWSEAELRQAGCIAVYRDPADLLARYDGSPFEG
jgi:HAD superfamily hydrolase (TIGR01549 family)